MQVNIAKLLLILLLWIQSEHLNAQKVYKTPYGEKYHLQSCRMVENVSKQLVGGSDVNEYGLEPCKICKPPAPSSLRTANTESNKAVGEKESVQCKGTTAAGTRCRHSTSIADGYCYQHVKQYQSRVNSSTTTSQRYSSQSNNQTSSKCGAATKSGGSCKRKVAGGGRCYQH
jgi:hypothetical protein